MGSVPGEGVLHSEEGIACWNEGPRARMEVGGGPGKAEHKTRSRQPTRHPLRLALNSLFQRKPHLPDAVHLSRDYEWKVDFKIFIWEKILILRKKTQEIFRMAYSRVHLRVIFTEQAPGPGEQRGTQDFKPGQRYSQKGIFQVILVLA